MSDTLAFSLISSLSLFLVLFLTFHLASTNKTLLHETCRKCAQHDPDVSYNFCVTTLESERSGRSARNVHELGLVSIKLLRRNVTDTRDYVKKYLKKRKTDLEPFAKACLQDCLELYSDASSTLKEAIRSYKARSYADVNVYLSAVMDAPLTCEDGFAEKEGVVSPLSERNSDVHRLSALALTTARLSER